MKNEWVQIVIAIMALSLLGAAEAVIPGVWGCGIPLLLGFAISHALHRLPVMAFSFALAAGGMEDAISSLPLCASVAFFLLLVMCVRFLPASGALWTAVGFVLYHFWLALWLRDSDGGIFLRALVALPLGAIAGLFSDILIFWIDRKAAVDVR